MTRSRREIIADALDEIDEKLQRIIDLLQARGEDIEQLRSSTEDSVSRLGSRVLTLEQRLGNGR